MTHIIVYTIPTSPDSFYVEVDGLNNLAIQLDKLAKTGNGATVKVFTVSPLKYKLIYKDKIKTITEQEPEVDLT